MRSGVVAGFSVVAFGTKSFGVASKLYDVSGIRCGWAGIAACIKRLAAVFDCF